MEFFIDYLMEFSHGHLNYMEKAEVIRWLAWLDGLEKFLDLGKADTAICLAKLIKHSMNLGEDECLAKLREEGSDWAEQKRAQKRKRACKTPGVTSTVENGAPPEDYRMDQKTVSELKVQDGSVIRVRLVPRAAPLTRAACRCTE